MLRNGLTTLLLCVLIFSLFVPAADAALVHRVSPGESLYQIAGLYDITTAQLLTENGYLRNPDHISAGQVLVVPVPKEESPAPISENNYTVKAGDTLLKISQQLGISMGELARINNLQDKNVIRTGQVLILSPEKPAHPKPQPEPEFAHTVSQLAQMFPGIFYLRGEAGTNKIALTFDDGPDGVYTEQVLDILKKHEVPATFFLIGEKVKRHSAVVERIHAENHTIGNHSWSHPDMRRLTESEVIAETRKTEEALADVIGQRTALQRPPYGAVTKEVIAELSALNYKVINWSADSIDWRDRDVDSILINTLPSVRGGGILLFHSAGGGGQSMEATVNALPELIETLRMQGYEFVTIDKLLQVPAYQ